MDHNTSSRELCGVVMHNWINSSPGPETWPVSMFNTVPLRLTHWQVRQMPRRQPNFGCSPADYAAPGRVCPDSPGIASRQT